MTTAESVEISARMPSAVIDARSTVFTPPTPEPPPDVPPDYQGLLMSKAVPLYTSPSRGLAFHYQVEAFPNVSYCVISPDLPLDGSADGAGGRGPGTAQITDIQDEIVGLQSAGIKVLIYIATDYATRELADILDAVDKAYAFYPTIDGIFFDTVADNQFNYYSQIRTHILTKTKHVMVLNPGTTTTEAYMGICDVMLNFESTYEAYLTHVPPVWQVNYDPRRFWHLVHTCDNFQKAAIALKLAQRNWVGNFFVTDKVMDFPWTPESAYENQITQFCNATVLPEPAPLNIPGLLGDWSAEHVTMDGNGTTVAVVLDQSAIAHDLNEVQSPNAGPLWVDGALDDTYHGRPFFQFDAVAWNNIQGNCARDQPFTLVVVYSADNLDAVPAGGSAVGFYDESGSGGNVNYTAGNFGAPGTVNKHGEPAIVMGVFDQAEGASQLIVSGVQAKATTPGFFGFQKMSIGAYAGGNNPVIGTVSRVLLYRGALGPNFRTELNEILSSYYAIDLG